MEVQIARNGVVISCLPLEDLNAAVANGTVFLEDYVWHEGLDDWKTVNELYAHSSQNKTPTSLEEASNTAQTPVGKKTKKTAIEKRSWQGEQATEKQIAYLKSFGVVTTPNLTKGEASELIERCLNDPETLKIQSDKRFAGWEEAMEQEKLKRTELGAYSFRLDVEKSRQEIASLKESKTARDEKIRTTKAEISALQKKLPATPEDAREAIEDQISELELHLSDIDCDPVPTPDDFKDYRDELKQFEAVRIKFWKATFNADWIISNDAAEFDALVDVGSTIDRLYEEYGHLFKTPTNKQISAILDVLDNAYSDWDKRQPEAFHALLFQNFPDLKRQPNAGKNGGRGRAKSKGCLVLIFLLTAFTYVLAESGRRYFLNFSWNEMKGVSPRHTTFCCDITAASILTAAETVY